MRQKVRAGGYELDQAFYGEIASVSKFRFFHENLLSVDSGSGFKHFV